MKVYFINAVMKELVRKVNIPYVIINVARLQNQSPAYFDKSGMATEIAEKGKSNAK